MPLPEHRGRMAVVGAMQEELAAVLASMPDAHCETVAGRQFWLGHFEGHDVVAVLSELWPRDRGPGVPEGVSTMSCSSASGAVPRCR